LSSVRDLIEALHPDGTAPRSGSDLVIGFGGIAELAPDGIAWIVVPPGGRSLARARARRLGLRISGSWLASGPRVLVPLSSASTATRQLLASRLAGGRLLNAVLGWKTRVIEELVPGVGLVVQRPGARPLLAWLTDAGVDGAVGISAGWHDARRLVLAGETVVVKSSSGAEDGLAREARVLQKLGPSVERAGAHAPTVVFHGAAGTRAALVESALSGDRVSTLLRREPARLATIVELVSAWLSRWHAETQVTRTFTVGDLERLILAPLRVVAPALRHGTHYAERVETLGRSLVDRDVSFAAAHNDLTTWNLLLEGDTLSVVDWEAAEDESLPLVDLDYFIVDATAAARRVERDIAFRSVERVQPDIGELARHACWLGHARNELSRGPAGPFLRIVEALAAS
jgi:hypothetical protein